MMTDFNDHGEFDEYDMDRFLDDMEELEEMDAFDEENDFQFNGLVDDDFDDGFDDEMADWEGDSWQEDEEDVVDFNNTDLEDGGWI